MMCLSTMSIQAQVITNETINSVYENATVSDKGEFAYNVERQGDDITTMYVYKKQTDRRGNVTLKPVYMHQYDYDGEGRLLSRTTMRWANDTWLPMNRLDYQLEPGVYSVAYSRWNSANGCFDQPCDKMTYTLFADDMVNHVYSYHRNQGAASYRLTDHMVIDSLSFYMDDLLALCDM